jgi:NitT/TauT family transport system ATP-binding protein
MAAATVTTVQANGVRRAARGRVEVREVSKGYGELPHRRQALDRCSLTIEAGKLNVVIGPSGCGKTVLLNLIAGFEKPDSGTLLLDGKPIMAPGPDRLVVFQETALFTWMTTYQNLVFGPAARGDTSASNRKAAEALLEQVGLATFRDKYPSQLSGGMQRRAELARAMINNPAVMLLDEPFRGLDAMTKTLMQESFLRLYEEEPRTVVFFTTDIDEAILLADRLFVLSNVPATLRTETPVNLPRPRTLASTFESDAANEIKIATLRILHEEALKSFRQGSKAAADFLDAYARRVR